MIYTQSILQSTSDRAAHHTQCSLTMASVRHYPCQTPGLAVPARGQTMEVNAILDDVSGTLNVWQKCLLYATYAQTLGNVTLSCLGVSAGRHEAFSTLPFGLGGRRGKGRRYQRFISHDE
jgi:hypothetical protein